MRRAALAIALALTCAPTAHAQPTGSALPGLESYDDLMQSLLKKWDVAGGALAVARRDRLVLARGYGVANRETKTPVTPESLFRLASLSKPVTAVAVLALVQDGRVKLDDKVVAILGDAGPRPDRIRDPRVQDITVRHLLQHAGGFDRTRSGDVMFLPHALDAARRQKASMPPDCPAIVRDTLERRLDFTPGERSAYSNVGFCLLGRIVERVARMPYEAYVRERVLAPAGVSRMRVGRTLEAADGEVTYYDYRGAETAKAMPGLGVTTGPRPYAQFAVETMDAYGGWIGSATDYLRFFLAIDGRRGAPLLTPATVAEMTARSTVAPASPDDEERNPDGVYYGLGVRLTPHTGGVNVWHSGSLPGTNTMAVRSADGFTWVVLFNGRPQDRNGFRRDVDRGLWAAKKAVTRWPDGDLFGATR